MKEETKQELSDDQKYQIFYHSALKKFNDYKKTRTFNDIGNVTYGFLVGLGIINYPATSREVFKADAQTKLLSELDRKDPKYREQAMELSDINSKAVVTEAKKMALADYFKSLMQQNIDLEEKIKAATK